MVECVRCGLNADSDLNYLHDEPICAECIRHAAIIVNIGALTIKYMKTH